MVMYYLERCWCSLKWLYFPIPVLPIKSRHQQFFNHNRVQTIILLLCHLSKMLIRVLSSTIWKNCKGFPCHIQNSMVSYWTPEPGSGGMDGPSTYASISQTIIYNMWSVMLVIVFSWRPLCQKAGLISTTGVPCAPSVSSSQLLSYCSAQLSLVNLLLQTNPVPLQQLALLTFNFKCIT